MKRNSGPLVLITTVVVLLATHPALAASYKAECLSDEGEFTSCKVKVQHNRFKVTYKSSEQHKSNVNISSEQIVQLFRRQYSQEKRRSFLSSVLGVAFSTLISDDMREKMGLTSQDSEENHEQIGVAYVDVSLTPEMREALIQERGGDDFEVEDENLEDEDLEEDAVDEEDVSQEDEGDMEGDIDEDDTQQFQEEDAQQVKAKTTKQQNLGTRLAKKAIIFDVSNERDAFALRQELKASTGLEFDQD